MPAGLTEGRLFRLEPPCDLAGLAMWDTSGGPRNGLALCKDSRLGDYHLQPLDDVAGLFAVRTDWGCDRVAVYYSGVKYVSGGTGATATTVPPVIEVQIRGGADGSQNIITTVNWTPAAYGGADLLIQVCARLCTQWEIWARTIPTEGEARITVGVAFRLLIDRSGGCRNDDPALQLGPGVEIPTEPAPPAPPPGP